MANISFSSREQFNQACFEQVAKIVNDYGSQVLECSVPALETEKCLAHLSLVAGVWQYDTTKIDAYHGLYVDANREMIEFLGECNEH